MTLGERIKNYRQRAGLSQEQLAEKINVSRQAVTKWENDSGMPGIDNLISLSKVMGISLDELVMGEKIMKITEFEQIKNVEIDIVKKVLQEIKIEDVALACKGTSPDNVFFLLKLYEKEKLEDEIKKLGLVPIVDVERQQLYIVNKINELL